MQAVMWLILAATVGLAALVTNDRRRASRVRLGDSVEYGTISIALPVKWKARTRAEGNPRIVVQANEPELSPRARTLTIFREQASDPLSPLQYLIRNFNVPPPPASETDTRWTAPAAQSIGGWPGVIVNTVAPPAPPNTTPPRVQFLACTVLPSRDVIVVKLEGVGPADASDAEAMRNICEAMRINGEPSLGHVGEPLELPGGVKLITPDGFVPVAANDANRTDRRLWLNANGSENSSPTAWSVIDLVPCLLDARDKSREQVFSAISTILAARDANWRTVNIVEQQPGRWRVQLETPSDRGAARGYVFAGATGRALLGIFHGVGDEQTFDRVWSQICSTTTFNAIADTDDLLSAGAAEVERVRGIGLTKLAGEAREEEWWLWCDQSAAPNLGWTHLAWELNGWSCHREMRFRRGEHRLALVTEAWQCNDDFSDYRADVTRVEGATGPQERSAESIAQSVQLARDRLKITRGRSVIQLRAPGQYVPGGLLPTLIGKLSDTPMILRTDSFPAFEALGAPNLLTLIIRPANDVPRNAEGETKPMRCISVEVNGSGRLSRWYFRENGELECIDFADGVQRLRSEGSSIQFTFHQDPLMMP
jgi:hypothetical protein